MEKKRQRQDFIIFVALDLIVKFIKWFGIKLLKLNGVEFGTRLLVVFLASLLLYYFVILVYDHRKMDPIKLELFKQRLHQKQENHDHSSTTRKIQWLRKFGNKLLTLALILIDPIVTVIYSRNGYFLWNGIPDIRTLGKYVSSAMFCTLSFSGFFYMVSKIFEILTELTKMIFN